MRRMVGQAAGAGKRQDRCGDRLLPSPPSYRKALGSCRVVGRAGQRMQGFVTENEAAGDVPAGMPRLLALVLVWLGPVGLEFFRFGLVGTAGFAVDAGILQLCLSLLGLG